MAQRGRHLAPTIRRISRTWVLPLTLVMSLVMGGLAWADTINTTNAIVAGVDTGVSSAAKAPGDTGTILVYLDPSDNATDAQNGCNANGSSPATLAVAVSGADAAKVSIDSPGSVTVEGCGPSAAASIGYSVLVGASGSVNVNVTYSSGGRGGNYTADIFTVNITATNQAPSQPGTPALTTGSSPNQGVFTLGWTASSDDGLPAGSTITYTLQHKDADDADFSDVAGGLTTNSYSFNAEAEGTWAYRVIASDGSLSSTPSAASSSIKVDQSDPNPPSLAADRAPEDSTGGWFRDTVTVTFTDNGDPNLADGSEGSGVDPSTIPPPVTKDTSGSHTITGTVLDNVGLESVQESLTVKVDATAPTVSFSDCPGQPLLLNSTATADWTASDAHSGLASAAGGSATLNTSTVGARFVTAMATDNVGKSFTATCNYSVIYDFDGFFAPVENLSAWNAAKAGQSIPVKFSLDGDQGLNIFDPAAPYLGAPRIVQIACPNSVTPDPIEEYATATANSKLIYDSLVDQYNYVWKTDKAWAGKCFRLDVKLIDGTIHSANFKLTK